HEVIIHTTKELCIDDHLLDYDLFILKSKQLFYLYAGHYIESNGIPVIPSPELSYKIKNRIEAHELLRKANIVTPPYFMGKANTLEDKLNQSEFPLIKKQIMGSGSKGISMINTPNDLESFKNELIYLEKFIEGTHYLIYFIGDKICCYEKQPLKDEHSPVKNVKLTPDIEKIVLKWMKKNDLLFGHLDMVKESVSNKLYVVDPGSFPEFSNWKCNLEPVSSISDLILERFEQIRLS
ncbi:MAG: ATP-grasp domain-containing protein, partial [Promethearchaeota archaeon]